MKIITETSLDGFNAWSGGEDTLSVLREKDLCDTLEYHIENDIFPDGCTDTELNDFLWFERDLIAELLGFSDWEDLEEDGDEDEEEAEDDNGLPYEANENYEEIVKYTIQCDTFEEFCLCNGIECSEHCVNCVFGCLPAWASCKEVFNRFKELEG